LDKRPTILNHISTLRCDVMLIIIRLHV